MANDEHVRLLKQGVAAWNAWRNADPSIRPNLRGADLTGVDLREANLSEANLFRADLSRADLTGASLREANLYEANLRRAYLREADLRRANLHNTTLVEADLREAKLIGADLRKANLIEANLWKANLVEAKLIEANLIEANLRMADLCCADLRGANLSEANLSRANLWKADLRGANLSEANLIEAKLMSATLVDTDFTGANLTGCLIHGVSAWRLKLDTETKQKNLVITHEDEPEITVDNIEVAQFIYLMLHNKKIRDVIDTITSKAVLILGRFTDERKAVLNALREEVRKRNYLPILFDFDRPASRDTGETITLLARMARFVIADLTDPSSIPKELEAIIPGLAVPVQPLIEGSARPFAMFENYWKYEWVLPVYRYEGLEPLLAELAENVIAPAEEKAKALEERRRMFEAELTKPQ
jgi:uncharacterized protein YjbI with pentapeptide repeats